MNKKMIKLRTSRKQINSFFNLYIYQKKTLQKSPRITSVLYCGGCSVLWGIPSVLRRLFSAVGDSISTAGDSISTAEE